MTPKEALKWLDEHNTSSVIPLEVKVLCLKALEKQIPKKPYREGIPQCPNCKGYTIADYDAGHYYNYCGDCGQAIDWSEEE